MADNQKVRVAFEFDRKDYDNVLFLLGAADHEIEEIEKTWEVLTSEEVVLKRDSFVPLNISPQEVISMFVTGAVILVEDKVKSR